MPRTRDTSVSGDSPVNKRVGPLGTRWERQGWRVRDFRTRFRSTERRSPANDGPVPAPAPGRVDQGVVVARRPGLQGHGRVAVEAPGPILVIGPGSVHSLLTLGRGPTWTTDLGPGGCPGTRLVEQVLPGKTYQFARPFGLYGKTYL